MVGYTISMVGFAVYQRGKMIQAREEVKSESLGERDSGAKGSN